MLDTTVKIPDRLIDWVGKILAVVLIQMVLNVAFDVMMRYLFRASSVGISSCFV